MRQADHSLAQAVERLLAFVAHKGEGLGAEHGAATLARIHERLHRRLSILVGEVGFQALFARAVELTRRISGPADIGTPTSADGLLKQLGDHMRTQTDEHNAAVNTALVRNFVSLMATLIGENLTLKLLTLRAAVD